MSKIIIENHLFETEFLFEKDYFSNENSFVQKILIFCRSWIEGKSSFTFYTSGSTGKPKSIEISKNQMLASVKLTKNALRLTSQDVAFIGMNTDFIAGKMMLARSLEVGMDMYIFPPRANPLESFLNSNYHTQNLTFTALVPYQIDSIISHPQTLEKLQSFRNILVGGAPISENLANKIRANLPKVNVFHTYGMTETVSHIALKSIHSDSDVYNVLEGISIEQDERNCLKIFGEVTQNQWITTNDCVELIDKTKFRWLGRLDNVINSGGIKLHLEEIEQKLEKLFTGLTWKRFFLYGKKDEKLGQKLILIIEGKKTNWKQEETLRQRIAQNLELYERPKEIFFVEKFIETDTQKIDRKKTFESLMNDSMF
ncbi:MAG: AMP-binding protein [Flammeovirgaceae bacterium]